MLLGQPADGPGRAVGGHCARGDRSPRVRPPRCRFAAQSPVDRVVLRSQALVDGGGHLLPREGGDGIPGRLLALHPLPERGLRRGIPRAQRSARRQLRADVGARRRQLYPERRRAPRGRAGRRVTLARSDDCRLERPIRGKGQASLGVRVPDTAGRVVTAELRIPTGRTDALELLDAHGRVVARGLWAGTAMRRVSFVVCGQRRLSLRVTRGGSPGRFAISLHRP
jgi:hypothetical protein